MFRIFRWSADQLILSRFSTRKLSTIEHLIENVEPETNFVKLIATSWEDSIKLPTGDQLCKVIQKCHNDIGQVFSISHMLRLSKKLLETNSISSISRGQKVNVNGYVRSIPFTTDLGKTRRKLSITPHDIKLYRDDEELPQDICIVMMTAHIESSIWHQNDLAMFDLRTHVAARNEEGEFTGKTSQYSHTVIVYDETIRNYVRNNLQRYDKVFIEGYLNYQKCKTDGGSNLMSGNIVALHIERA